MIATMSIVWDRTAEFLSDNLSALAPIVLFGIFAPLTILGNITVMMGTMNPAANATLALVAFLLALATSWAGLAITALAFDPAAGRGPALQAANRRIVPVIGIGIVTLIGIIVLALPSFVAIGLSGMDFTQMAAGKQPSPGSVNGPALLFAALYMLLYGLFLLYASARLILISPIMIMERRGLGVFARSFVLTRSIAWKVVGVLILYLVVSSVASMAAKAVFGTVFALLLGNEGTVTLASVLTQIVAAAISTIFSVLAVAFIAKLYLASRDAREAIVEAA